MGSEPGSSVVDPFGEVHAVANLVVADSSVFPTSPEKNPTLTMMALGWRAMDRLADNLA